MKFNDLKIPKNGAKALLQWLYPATWMESEGKTTNDELCKFWLVTNSGHRLHNSLPTLAAHMHYAAQGYFMFLETNCCKSQVMFPES